MLFLKSSIVLSPEGKYPSALKILKIEMPETSSSILFPFIVGSFPLFPLFDASIKS